MRHLLLLSLTAFTLISLSARADESDNLFAPSNAFGPALSPLPEHGKLAGQNEFYNRFRDGSLIMDLPQQVIAAQQTRAQQNQELIDQADALIGGSRATLLYRILTAPPQIDAAILIRNQKQQQKITLMGRDAALRDVVGAKQNLNTRENLQTIHAYLHSRLGGEADLPVVDSATVDLETLRVVNDQLLARFEVKFGIDTSAPIAEYGKCEMEDGSGAIGGNDEGDQLGHTCKASPAGLVAGADWALRSSNSCVRNEGYRGTSAAFALVAAIESRVAKEERRLSNFSEQHLYQRMAGQWFRSIPDSDDHVAPLFSTGIAKAIGYQFHYEDMWSYNGSNYRAKVQASTAPAYSATCKNYKGRHCSNTNHQSRMLCTVVGEFRFCGYDAPMTAATPVRVNGMGLIYDVTDPTPGLNAAVRWLRSGVPVVMTFTVPLSFAQNVGGYIGTPNEAERVLGAQTALVTGWVPNAAVPAGAPQGSGGGYFVIKNSWGKCVGDAGYYYVPVDWVRSNALNLTVVF